MTVLDAQRITDRLARPLPGILAQIDMAPVYRQDPDMASIRDKACTDAAVLLLLHESERGDALLFIERPGHLLHHAGQIAFPGGRREDGEPLQDTALREAHEEVGLPASTVTILGMLTPLFVPPSGYCVHPFVGYAARLPDLVPQESEVADIFSVPIHHLADPSCRAEVPRRVKDRTWSVPCFVVDGRQIWGATAMMLAELVAVVRDSLPELAAGAGG
jgi:8-oxo-dGTP pyrophosphatase MutT (NUDIX family)